MTDKAHPEITHHGGAVRLGRAAPAFRYVYFWHRMNRKGAPCAVLARGTMNSCLVLFEDGFTAVTSRNAITGEFTGARGRQDLSLCGVADFRAASCMFLL